MSIVQPDFNKDFFLKEIELIQSVISRMANNSFLIKGWTITLVVVSMLLSTNPQHRLLAFIPCIAFWYLDAFFLQLERQYRHLYDWVIENRPKTNEYLFNLDSKRFSHLVGTKMDIMLSETLSWFYGGILVLVILFNLEAIVLLISLL